MQKAGIPDPDEEEEEVESSDEDEEQGGECKHDVFSSESRFV